MSFKNFLLGLSLGNLGDKAWNINELDLKRKKQRLEMFCETGVIGEVAKHGIAMVERYDKEISYFEDTYCSVDILEVN